MSRVGMGGSLGDQGGWARVGRLRAGGADGWRQFTAAPPGPPTYVLGGECFISLLGKIHAFCMVELKKKGTLCTFEFRSNMRRSDIFFPVTRLGESCYNRQIT